MSDIEDMNEDLMAPRDDDERATFEVIASDLMQEEAPRSLDALAAMVGRKSEDLVFRIAVWQAMEATRRRTGVQMYTKRGMVYATTPAQQFHEAEKMLAGAARRCKRGHEVGALAVVRDGALAPKYERTLQREAQRAAAEDAGLQAQLEERRRAAIVRGDKI